MIDNVKEGKDTGGSSKKRTASSWLEVIALSMADAMAQKSSTMMTVCSWLMLILCHAWGRTSKQRA